MSNVTIQNTNINGFDMGVYLESASNSVITRNNITNSNTNGILFYTSSNNSISENSIEKCSNGILLTYSSLDNIVSRNNITDGNWHGIGLHESSNNTISRNNVTNNGIGGIRVVENSFHNLVSENEIANPKYLTLYTGAHGIWIQDDSAFNNFSGNYIKQNYDGIYIKTVPQNNTFSENYIVNNENGVWCLTSNNVFYHNNFINNDDQVGISGVGIWDDGYPSGGNYWSDYAGVDNYRGPNQDQLGSDRIGDTPYVIDGANQDNYPLMKPYGGAHDIGITNVVTSKNVVGQGYILNITVTVFNYDIYTENRNITVYANTTTIASQNITITSRNSTTVTFTWNTTGFAEGNYTVSVVADIILGETDTEDNTLLTWVYVGIPGDLNADGTVDVFDAVILSGASGSEPGASNWNPNADINGDEIVDLFDAVILSGHAGETET